MEKRNTLKNSKQYIFLLLLFLIGFIVLWFNYQITLDKRMNNMNKSLDTFIKTCYSDRTITEEDFNNLVKEGVSNNYEIKLGINSENLTIDKNNMNKNINLSGIDKVVVLAEGYGALIRRIDFNPNMKTHRYQWKGQWYSY